MSYTTLSSEQIVSKAGELTIDVFSSLEQGDKSIFKVNCNSILKDGLVLNCPKGGIKLESNVFNTIQSEYNIRTDVFNLEILKTMDVTSLNNIDISAINIIKIGNNNDGLIHDIYNQELKLINKEVNSKIIINSPNIILLNKFNRIDVNKNIKIKIENTFELVSQHKSLININTSTNTLDIDANVNITGELKFTQLVHQKVKKLKLEDIADFLEFGNKKSPIKNWTIGGFHNNNTTSSINFNYNNNEFTFNYNDTLSKITAGELNIEINNNTILQTTVEHTKINNVVTGDIKCFKLEGDSIYCNKIFINGNNIFNTLTNIYNNTGISLRDFIKEKKYVLLDCNIKQNVVIEGDTINIYGFYRNIIFDGMINVRNSKEISRIEKVKFINSEIIFNNIQQIIFTNCTFSNTQINSLSSKIVFNNCVLDELTKISADIITINDSQIACSIIVNNYCKIYNNNIIVNNNTIRLEKKNIIYQFCNNIYKLFNPVKQYIIADIDILLCNSWYLDIKQNSNIYETKLILNN